MNAKPIVSTQKSEKPISKRQFDWVLALILLLALFLYGWQIWKAGSANSFYTAAIKSMTLSFKNFWYGSFDPAGYITVDKPPIALWFMAISAKLFGLHGWSVVLPSVLFGVGSVYLMARLVSPYFGRNAGRLSALAMTITPIVVADSRTNNMDATLIFFLLLAVWFLQKAIRLSKLWPLIVSFSLIGIAFNIKMLQAFMILPAMYLFYWLAAKMPWRTKIVNLAFATIGLAVFTLAYPLSVDLTPASQRPYVGGSQHNSELELAFGYNGTQRLLGQTTGTGGRFGAGMTRQTATQTTGKLKTGGQAMSKKRQVTKGKLSNKTLQNMKGMKRPTGNPGQKRGGQNKGAQMGGAGNAFNIGTIGPLRLFQSALGPQISWLLPFSLIGLIAGFIDYRDRRKRWYQMTSRQKQLMLWLGWLVPVYGFFAIASFFHPYYMIMLAPPIAALFGIGFWSLLKLYKTRSYRQGAFYLLPIAILSTAALQAWYVYSYYPWATWLIMLIAVLTTAFLLFKPKVTLSRAALAVAMVAIMISPSWWALTPTLAAQSAQIPTTGPDLLSSRQSGGTGNMDASLNTKLLSYLEKHQGNAKYLFATSDSLSAAPYIIKTGKAVMAMGGYNGTDPAITLSEFKHLVKTGQLKYFYASGRSGNSTIVNWIKRHATKVKSSLWEQTSSSQTAASAQKTMTKGKTQSKSAASPTKGKGMGRGKAAQGMPKGGKPGQSSKRAGKKPNRSKQSGQKMKRPSKSKRMTKAMGGPSGMGGQSGVLYDLSTIYK